MRFLLGMAVGGCAVWYYLTKAKPSAVTPKETLASATITKSANGLSVQELSKEIDAVHATIPIDLNAVTPNYGKPIDLMNFASGNQRNFVNVVNNDYFKPKMGTFRPIQGYSNPNIIGVPINLR